jgi:O-antigen/teichoic acid export membrane protein
MTQTSTPPVARPETSIITRFAHLLSAQGVEGICTTGFFLYLAWLDATVYGQIMYGIAAGGIVMKVVQYGLYYPLVADLGTSPPERAPEVLNRVNVIKLVLMVPTMIAVVGIALYREFALEMSLVLISITLGFALDGFADTFFADLRVRGRQDREARVKIVATVASFGYGFAAAALGLSPVAVSLFRLISSGIRVGYGIVVWIARYSSAWLSRPDREPTLRLFRTATAFAFIEILGVVYNKTNIFFLESATAGGVRNVALYSATWNLVDAVSILVSEQFLGWVIFPLLATLWNQNRREAADLIRVNARWLLVMSFPVMFVLHTGSDFFIRTIYPADYAPAAWMQRYLVWTIVLSFEQNLFAYVMMVAGAARRLLVFTAIATILNVVFNVTLVERFDLAGGCLVIILTKLVMTVLTFCYCQASFRLFGWRDLAFPVTLAATGLLFYAGLRQFMIPPPAVAVTVAVFFLALRQLGARFLGSLPRSRSEESCAVSHAG